MYYGAINCIVAIECPSPSLKLSKDQIEDIMQVYRASTHGAIHLVRTHKLLDFRNHQETLYTQIMTPLCIRAVAKQGPEGPLVFVLIPAMPSPYFFLAST